MFTNVENWPSCIASCKHSRNLSSSGLSLIQKKTKWTIASQIKVTEGCTIRWCHDCKAVSVGGAAHDCKAALVCCLVGTQWLCKRMELEQGYGRQREGSLSDCDGPTVYIMLMYIVSYFRHLLLLFKFNTSCLATFFKQVFTELGLPEFWFYLTIGQNE
jgi:hypothetical protein